MFDKKEEVPHRKKSEKEVEQPDTKEWTEHTPHPDKSIVESNSEELRYKNADSIYE
ncbi:hypothetical protein [Alteribacillus sp. HJP-4]|uniref:hypothetical protein n=1 Tax=Alteribacillus sp. HJP-4 TaxID=2775394 RepID=UPI0035CD01E2